MSIFTPDTSIQLTGNSTNAITYNTKDNPNLAFHSRAGIYNSADNVIKIFTNNADALTINSSGQVICNGSLITDISWTNIAGKPMYFAASWNLLDFKPSIFPTNWANVDGKPSIFPTNWDNVASKPSIFPTDWTNVASKPTNFQTDWDTTVLNRPLIFTQVQTSNIFVTSNVIQNTQDFINYSKLAGRPSLATVATSGLYNDLSGIPTLATVATSGLFNDLSGRPSVYPTDWTNVSLKPTNFQSDWNSTIINKPSLATVATSGLYSDLSGKPDIFTKTELSNIFVTSNVLSNTSNTLYNNVNLANYFTKQETSNIFVTSNVLSNTSNTLYNNVNLANYFTRIETSNIFVTSNVIQNSVGFIDYNNLANKPTIGSGAGQFWSLDAPTNLIYNNNTDGSVVVNGTTINNGYRFKVNGNIWCDGSNIKLSSSTSGNLMSIQFQDSLTGYYSTAGCAIYKIPTHEFIIMNYTTSRLFFGVGGNIRAILDNTNNFSIGTAVSFPAARLHLNQTGGAEIKILMTDANTGHTGTDGCAIIKQSDNHMNIMNYEANDIIFSTNAVERMRITSAGNVNANSGTITTLASTTASITTINNVNQLNVNNINITGNITIPFDIGIRTGDNLTRFYCSINGITLINALTSIDFYTNNLSKAMTLNEYGQLLITTDTGVLTPQGMLHLHRGGNTGDAIVRLTDGISGSGAANGVVLWKETNNNCRLWNYQNADLIFGTNNAERMRIKNDGLIGVGISTPTAMLHIHKTTSSSDVMIRLTDSLLGTTASDGLVLWKDTNQDGRFWNYENKALIFGTNNAERMRIKDNGYIGIGDTNCAGKLTIKSAYDNANDGIIINATDDGTGNEKYMMKIYPYVVGAGAVGYRFRVINSPTANYGTDAITFDNDGRVFFGNECVMKTNTWNRSSDLKNRFYFGNNGRTYFGSQDGYEFRNNNDGYLGQLTNAGFLGLSIGTPTYRLHVAAGTTNSGNAAYRYFNAGTALTASTTNYTDCCANFGSTIIVGSWIASSSDIRIKKDIKDVDKNEAIETLLKLKPKKYKYIDNVVKSDREVIGFVAQEVKEIIPDAVNDKNKEVIPNIYKCYNVNGNIISVNEDLKDELKIGDKIEYLLENENDRKQTTILEITDIYIKIDIIIDYKNTKIFIVGKYVDDFQTISKDDIFSLNVCATQELYRIIQQQSSIINDLKNRIEFLENKLNI